ncbi:LPXTG cell wall anchor domain-containing protein [uncultured Enterococcus sp.]|uniref:LPXTG cell wall anchor domain-containing protein n=1 Tax=uncultured Enterococcus sp. TaxID=167972 RepID=UPI002AA86E84|nr:LPXTG cell wall anchor domain-containing protein [uncultured Enterococcus sp.]
MKMKSKIRKAIYIGVGLVFLLLSLVIADAAQAVELPPGMVIGDDQGIKIEDDGEYLIDVRDVMPGKAWSVKITISNLERDIPYHLTMRVSKPTLIQGTLDLSEAIQMKLIYDGEVIYSGPLSGDNGKINLQDVASPVDLGTFKSGDTRMLEAYFELDGAKYGNSDFFEKNIVENIWYFKAVKTKLPDTSSSSDDVTKPGTSSSTTPGKDIFKLPNTGEEWRNALVFVIIGMFLVMLALLIVKHKVLDKKKS